MELINMYRDKKTGFTFVEVILVMALVSFLYIVTMKVIQHNLDQKVPVYVYNLYKNLDNESKLLTKKLIEEANSSEGGGSSSDGSGSNSNQKTIDDVLKGMDAKTYCQAFANDANLIGNINCTNSSTEEDIGEVNTDKKINFNCTRDDHISFGYLNNTYEIKSTGSENYDSTKVQCSQNKIIDDNQTIICNAKPTQKVDSLFLDNTQSNYTYNCQKIKEASSPDYSSQTKNIIGNYNVDTKIKIQDNLKTTNNIHLFFKTLYAKEIMKGQYNLKVNVSRDQICPKLDTLSTTITESDTHCNIDCTAKIDNSTQNTSLFKIKTCTASSSISDSTLTCTPSVIAWVKKLASRGDNWINALTPIQVNEFTSKTANVTATTSMKNNCQGYLAYAKDIINNTKKYNSGVTVTKNVNASKGGSCKDHARSICGDGTYDINHTRNVYMSLTAQIILSNKTKEHYKEYYNKWYNFFEDHSNLTKQTYAAIKKKEYSEGIINGTENLYNSAKDDKQYLAHFIYAAIDTSFEKGEMGKNIFVFEQFGNKIIPVGYLANNQNTPLKFNVITRKLDSFKIEKVNEKPLTFCEAMKYTGEKFSQYCGCKDANGKIVTQYTKNTACENNFGCMIKPVSPSNVTPKFKLF